MFSVEDLLISHGYKLSTNTHDSYENKGDGCHYEISQKRSGHGTSNGYETDSRVHSLNKNALPKGYYSDNEDKQGSHKVQTTTGNVHRDQGGVAALHTSEAGSYGSVPLRWCSRPKTDKGITHWRRRGQDFSVLLGHTDKEDTETKENTPASSKGIPPTNSRSARAKEELHELGKITRNVIGKEILHESSKTSVGYQQQGLNTETWTSQRRISGNDDSKTTFQDISSVRSGRNALASKHKEKWQSLPRVLSPENTRHVDIAMMSSDNALPRDTNIMPHPRNRIHLDLDKNSKTENNVCNLPKPKYSRPTKPPSYQFHQQIKGTGEVSRFQEETQNNEQNTFYINEPRQDFYTPDSGMEPPVYVPPPSYKSPLEQNVNDTAFQEVPNYGMCSEDDQMPHWVESPSRKQPLPLYNVGSGGQHCIDNNIPFEKVTHNTHVDCYNSSVQYIPFDDPRIRHLKIGHDEGHYCSTKEMEKAHLAGYRVSQGKRIKEHHQAGAFLDTEDLLSNVTFGTQTVISANSSKCSDTPPKGKEIHGLLDQTDSASKSNGIVVNHNNRDKLPAREEHSHGACENVTKVKKFEAETEIKCKIGSRKKVNETVFCLVSVPVTTVSYPSNTDKNNNDLTQSKNKIIEADHSSAVSHKSPLLSSSSTDSELQYLAGRMTNKNWLEKQEQCQQEEYKQTSEPGLIKPRKHRELKYSGSWPGDQCRDQQYRDICPQETLTSRHFSDANQNRPHDKRSGSTSMTSAHVKGSERLSDNCGQKTYNIEGQMYFDTSFNSAFERTRSAHSQFLKPKAYQSQMYGPLSRSTNGKEECSVPKGKVVKGEVITSCNSKEPFGQFLLKPASRRPCDAISELEILYKELQEGESGQSKGSLEDEEEQQAVTAICNSITNHKSNMQSRYESKPEKKVPGTAILRPERVKSKSESWSMDLESDNSQIFSGFEFPLRAQDFRGGSVRSAAVNKLGGRKIRDLEAENNTNEDCVYTEGSVSSHRLLKSHSMNANETKLHPHASVWKTCIDQFCIDDGIVGHKNPSKTSLTENNNHVEKDAYVMLSSANKNIGLYEPHLSILSIDGSSRLGRNMPDTFHENQDTFETPDNESLQSRAARILGIEVSNDSFSKGAIHGPHLTSEIGLGDHEYSKPDIFNGTEQTNGVMDLNSSVVIDKHALSENKVFNGEMKILSTSLSHTFTFLKLSNSNEVNLSTENDLAQLILEKLEPNHNTFCQSIEKLEPDHTTFCKSIEKLEPDHSTFCPSIEKLEPDHSTFCPSIEKLEPDHSTFCKSIEKLESDYSVFCQSIEKLKQDNSMFCQSIEKMPGYSKFSQSTELEADSSMFCQSIEKVEEEQSRFCRPILFQNGEKKAVTPSSERKAKSTSKMIETLQEKLASTPKRMATDRLVRMKEVHSVSRMRRLSIKRSDSGDEADDEKEPYKAEEEEGSQPSSVSQEPSHKIMIQTSVVSKRTITLDESADVTANSRNTFDEDIFYLDSYDPTRVERV